MSVDRKYMSIALRLARKGLGLTSPNPPVGAVIVINDRIVGTGWHRKAGMPHAEVEAIEDAIRNEVRDFSNATIYITLEPCCHYGKTPPCVDRLIQEKFRRVVIATVDPNPCVCGSGLSKLRSAGIYVDLGILEDKAKELIEFFTTYIVHHRAFLGVKWAQSIDGRISAGGGTEKYLSSEPALKFVHKLRGIYDAIIIGRHTLEIDNPSLTTRLVKGRNPLRIVVGGRTKIDPHYNVFTDGAADTVLVTMLEDPWMSEPPDAVEVWRYPGNEGTISMKWILEKLAQRGLTSALLEGGGYTITRAFAENIVDKVYAVITPQVLGSGINAVVEKMPRKFSFTKVRRLDPDILIEAKPKLK